MIQTLNHQLEIGDHVTYWYEGEACSGTIKYFSTDHKHVFIKDDFLRTIRRVKTEVANYYPLISAS